MIGLNMCKQKTYLRISLLQKVPLLQGLTGMDIDDDRLILDSSDGLEGTVLS
jgi:hypothetical protein